MRKLQLKQMWLLSLALAIACVQANVVNSNSISESVTQEQRSLIGSLLGSLAVNSPGERGVLSTLFPTLFPAPSNTSLNQGVLDRLFSNTIKAQILQAEADYINLNAQNTALASQTAIFSTWRTLCNATAGTTKNLTTGLYFFEASTANVKNWFGARNLCRAKGMDLLNIENAEEAKVVNDEITRILNESKAVTDAATNAFWIGLNNIAEAVPNLLRYSWDGAQSGPAVSFTDWHSNQPTATPNFCAQVAQRNGGILRWTSTICTDTARFICEMPEPCRGILRA